MTCSSPPAGTLEYFDTIKLFIFKPIHAATWSYFDIWNTWAQLTLNNVPLGYYATNLGINTNLFAY